MWTVMAGKTSVYLTEQDGHRKMDLNPFCEYTGEVNRGYQQNDYRDIVQEQAIDFEILDVTENGKADLVFLLNKPGRLLFYHSFANERDMELPTPRAVNLKSEQVGQLLFTDINVDGETDFLVSGW